jgi:hypothetical protein
MTGLLARLLVGLPLAVLAAAAQLLLGVVRLLLWMLGRVGFRGARLAGLAATLAGVGWAAQHVGVGPAARLAVIGWVAWATRHHRAQLAQQAAVRRLTAALEQHTSALATATRPLPARPTTTTTAPARQVPPAAPWPAANQPPDQGVAALGRYAAAWVRRHTPAGGGTPPRPPRRPPR